MIRHSSKIVELIGRSTLTAVGKLHFIPPQHLDEHDLDLMSSKKPARASMSASAKVEHFIGQCCEVGLASVAILNRSQAEETIGVKLLWLGVVFVIVRQLVARNIDDGPGWDG